jgi:predicted ATPase
MIHRVRIQNFKSILDVTVDLSPVTVLVGRSGTGKSNFVHALRFLRDLLLAQRQQIDQLQQNWDRLRPAVQTKEPTCFEIDFSIAGMEEHFRYILVLAKENLHVPPITEHLYLGAKTLFHQKWLAEEEQLRLGRPSSSKWLVNPELLHIPEPGPLAIGRIPSIQEIVIAFTALTTGIGCYAFSDRVLCGNDQYRPRFDNDHMQIGLDDEALGFLETLKEIVSNLQDLHLRKSMIGALQRINPSISSVELNDIRQPSHIVVGHKFNGKTIPLQLSQESDGFRRFYAHLLALYQRPPKQTLLFEHPEDGIHPGALSVLAEEFKAAPPNGRGQVILTTHSPKLLDQFEADQIRVVELDGYQTRIGRISDEQKQALDEKLLYPGELLTVDPARMQQEAAGT